MKKTSMKALSLLLALALCLPTFLMVAANEGEDSEENASDEKVNVTTEAEYESLYVHDVDGDGVSDLCFFYDAFSHTAEDGVPTEIVDRFGNQATLVDNKSKALSLETYASYTDGGLYIGAQALSLSAHYVPTKDAYLELVISQTGEYALNANGNIIRGGTLLVGPFKCSIQMNQDVDANGDPVKNRYPIDESYGIVSGTYWSGVAAMDDGLTTTQTGTDVHWSTTHFLGGAKGEIFTAGIGVDKDKDADSPSYLPRYARDTVFTLTANKGGALYAPDADRLVEIGYAYPVNYHAVRLYSAIPTAEQLRQNHFADIALYTRLDLTEFYTLSEEERATLYTLCASIMLSDEELEAKVEDAFDKLARARKKSIENLLLQSLYAQEGATLLWSAFDKEAGDALSEDAFTVDTSASYGNGYLFNNGKQFDLSAYLPNFTYGSATAQKDYTVELVMSMTPPQTGSGWTSTSSSNQAWYFGNMKANFSYRKTNHSNIADGPMTASIPESGFVPGASSGSSSGGWGDILGGIFGGGNSGSNLFEVNNGGNYLFAKSADVIFTSTLAFDLTLGEEPSTENDTIAISLYRDAEKLSISALDTPIKYDATNTNDTLKIGLGCPLNFYAIRVYETTLDEEAMQKNRFVDLLSYYRPENLLLLDKLSADGLQAVKEACKEMTFETEDARLTMESAIEAACEAEGVTEEQEKVFRAEDLLTFEGYAVKMFGERAMRATFSVCLDAIGALPEGVSVLEVGALVTPTGEAYGNEGMDEASLTLAYAAEKEHAQKEVFYLATEEGATLGERYHAVFSCEESIEGLLCDYLARGYITLLAGEEEFTLYLNADSEKFGDFVSMTALAAAVQTDKDYDITDLNPELILFEVLDEIYTVFENYERTISFANRGRQEAEKKYVAALEQANELVSALKKIAEEGASEGADTAAFQADAALLLATVAQIREDALAQYPDYTLYLKQAIARVERLGVLATLAELALDDDEGFAELALEFIGRAEEDVKLQREGANAQQHRDQMNTLSALAVAEKIGARIATGEFGAVKSLKVLAIGNSFSVDALAALYEIAESFGYEEIVLGNAQYKDATIEKHCQYALDKQGAYTYVRHDSQSKRLYGSMSLADCVKDEAWDVITLQQAGQLLPNAKTINNKANFNDMLSFINREKTNENVKVYFHATWAFATDHAHADLGKTGYEYLSDRSVMSQAIDETVRTELRTRVDIAGVIYSYAAIDAATARFGDTAAGTNSLYKSVISNKVETDGYHLSAIGSYIVGLTWFGTLTGEDISEAQAASGSNLSGDDLAAAISAAQEGIARANSAH